MKTGKTSSTPSTAAAPSPATKSSRSNTVSGGGAGNLSVQRLYQPGSPVLGLQTSRPGDASEREADHVADYVIGEATPRSPSGIALSRSAPNVIQMKPDNTGGRARGNGARKLTTAGQPLATSARSYFEPRFGQDFSDVRVHSYPSAHADSHRLGARAFTVGRDIAFAPGEYAPDTAPGKKLLAHELAHVVQQAGGGRLPADGIDAPWLRPTSAQIQADGELTEEDMRMIRAWLQTQQPNDPANPAGEFRGGTQFPSRLRTGEHPLEPFPRFQTADFRSFDRALASTECPGSCHQVNEGFRRQAAERAAAARERARRESWHGMHQQQHEEELGEQAQTLEEDIQTSEISASQLRLQLFERALAGRASVSSTAGATAPTDAVTEEMRDAWSSAQQATLVLEAILNATDEAIPADVTAPLREAYVRYYTSLTVAIRAHDNEIRRAEARMRAQRTRCVTNCHQLNPSRVPSLETEPSFTRLTLPGSQSAFGLPGDSGIPTMFRAQPRQPEPDFTAADIDPGVGPREQRMLNITEGLAGITTEAAWRTAIGDFRWATSQMDELLMSQVPRDSQTSELIEQFTYTRDLLARQRQFMRDNPDAIKIQAVFYPKFDFTQRTDDQGRSREVARGIPWQFYLTRTPLEDDRYIPTGYEWQLHDITAARRDNRTVRTRYQITAIEALGRERGPWSHPQRITQIDPPDSLFAELNHRDFFPEGMLYWHAPVTGRTRHMEMTDPTPFGDWLVRIGMAIAILGSLVFAPFSTPALVAAAVGTGLMIAGRTHRLMEQDEHGVLTDADVHRFYWDLAMDLVSMMTMGLGRVAAVSARAGNLVRAAAAQRYWFMLRRVELGMDVINIGVVTHDFVQQYRNIMNARMTPEQRRAALEQLTMFAMLSGVMSTLPIATGIRDLRRRPTFNIDVDPRNPSRLMATVGDDLAESAGHLRTRAQDDAQLVGRVRFRDARGESHTFGLWSDGRITRCSEPPCLQIAESIVTRLDDMSGTMLSDSAHLDDMAQLLTRARQLREEAEQLARGPRGTLAANQEQLLQRAQQIETDLATLQRNVDVENQASSRTGREEAERRWGQSALDYNREHYRWVRRRDGRLEFQRTRRDVPWRRYNPDTGQFEITRSLFEAVSPERMAELNRTSSTSGFRIAAEVSSLAELNRLRPITARRTRPPEDWVLVRVNDENAYQFIDEPLRYGEIRLYPDGSRAWRTRTGTIATEGAVRAPIGRRGFEMTYHPQYRQRRDEQGNLVRDDQGNILSNEGMPTREATGVDHQRSHPQGQGTGFEMPTHIPYAPTYVNQQLQNEGIELFLRTLREQNPNLDIRLITEHSNISGTLRQERIDYRVEIVSGGQRRELFQLGITTNYRRPRAPADVEVTRVTRNAADLDLLHSVDMPAALQALRERVRRAMTSRPRR